LNEGGNYGVVGGFGSLVIFDFDDLEALKLVNDKLPPTFTCKSGGKGMPHVYYVLENDAHFPKFPIKNNEGRTLIDIQCDGSQVVGPGSKLANGGQYSVVDDMPIAKMSVSFLQALFESQVPENKPKPMRFPRPAPQEGVVGDIKRHVRMSSVLSTFGIDVRHRPTMCPMNHSSQNGKCFSFDDGKGLGHCFNCGWGGDIIKLVMDKKNLNFIDACKWIKDEFNI
jgi:hypothetical protein